MSLLKTAVFLASRFDEFKALRDALKTLIADYPVVHFAPVDLNNGNVSHRPPLPECLGYVRQSEFMILLLGDTYGSLAPRNDKSFTHLEYEEAIREGSGTRVLAFGIGELYRAGRIRYSSDERLCAWQRQLEENHTLGFFEPEEPVEAVAKRIFDKLLAALYEMRFGALAVESNGGVTDELFDDVEDDSLLDDAEVRSLEGRNSRGPSLVDERARFANTLAAVTQPAAVAAFEQREEAQRALDVGEHGIAVQHLKRALEFKPLELISNYWLAQLYVVLGRKEKAVEAGEMAERAARIAQRDSLPYRASAAWIIASRAATLAGHPDKALVFARYAVEVAPRFSKAYIELARQHTLRSEGAEALEAIRRAFALHPKSIREVFADPVFRPMRKPLDALVGEIQTGIARDVADLIRTESEIAALAQRSHARVPFEARSISRLIEIGRQSSQRQYEDVCVLLNAAERKRTELRTEAPKQPPATRELLRFNRPGRALIVEWLKQPGEIIDPDEAVFSFRYEESTKVVPWCLRIRAPVRMVARTGDDGVWVSSENPYLFEHVTSDAPLAEPGRVQRLRMAIEQGERDVSAAEDRVSETRYRQTETAGQLNAIRRSRTAASGGGALLAGILFGIGAFALIRSGQWGAGVGMAAVAAYLANIGMVKLRAHRAQRQTLASSLAEIERELSQCQDHAAREAAKLNALRKELTEMEAAAEEIRARASAALDRFEGSSLRKGGRLLPFSSIFGARKGELVRVFDGQLARIAKESGREITVEDDLREWVAEDPQKKPKARLVRATEVSASEMLLSHRLAYVAERAN